MWRIHDEGNNSFSLSNVVPGRGFLFVGSAILGHMVRFTMLLCLADCSCFSLFPTTSLVVGGSWSWSARPLSISGVLERPEIRSPQSETPSQSLTVWAFMVAVL